MRRDAYPGREKGRADVHFFSGAHGNDGHISSSGRYLRINVSTAPIYGALEPERRAMLLAAQETVSGYDKFIVLHSNSSFNQNVIGQIPAQASGKSDGSFQATGSQNVAMPRFASTFTIKMFMADDPAGRNAVDARAMLQTAPKQ